MVIRLGELLVQRGAITEAQRVEILDYQRVHHRPFGLLAEQMFGVSPRAVEQAWAAQYAAVADRVDACAAEVQAAALALVHRRQAWQFGVLPLRIDGGEVVVATTQAGLARAMRFIGWKVEQPARYVIAEEGSLRAALSRHYPMAEMDDWFAPVGRAG